MGEAVAASDGRVWAGCPFAVWDERIGRLLLSGGGMCNGGSFGLLSLGSEGSKRVGRVGAGVGAGVAAGVVAGAGVGAGLL